MLDNTSKNITGNGNTIVGGNFYASNYPINKKIKNIIDELDEKINKKIKVYSSTQSKEQKFSSEKMLLSLFSIGIPIEAGIQICQGIEVHFSNLETIEESISTTEIRKIICSMIYRLREEDFNRSMIRAWGDKYIRTYGHPDQRIIVIHKDGSQEYLDFRFLKDSFMPFVISEILRFPPEKVEKIISRESVSEMAEEILGHVRSLNLYSIRYKTLFNLTYDIAVQPPHPWFSEQAFMSDVIKYDLSKASNHINNFQLYKERHDIFHYWHACIETVRHSCSAVLGFYGCYMGTKEYTPLANLVNVLQIYKDEDFYFWEFLKIKQIEGDLIAIDNSVDSFHRLLTKINQQIFISDMTLEKCDNFSLKAKQLYQDVRKLITDRDALDDEYKKIASNAVTDNFEYIEFCKKTISRIPGIKINHESSDYDSCFFWVINRVNVGIYAELKPKILFYFLDDTQLHNNEIDELTLNKAISLLRSTSKYALSVFFIYNGYIKEKTNIYKNFNENIFILDKDNMLNMYLSDDRVGYLEDFILNNI